MLLGLSFLFLDELLHVELLLMMGGWLRLDAGGRALCVLRSLLIVDLSLLRGLCYHSSKILLECQVRRIL